MPYPNPSNPSNGSNGYSPLPDAWSVSVVNGNYTVSYNGTPVQQSSTMGTTLATSVTTGVGSFHLGQSHALGSSGENVVFKNNNTNVCWFPTWQGQSVDGTTLYTPSTRAFSAQTIVEPVGSVNMSGVVSYANTYNLGANTSITNITIIPAETYNAGITWAVTTNNVQVAKIYMPAGCISGTPLTVPFDYPMDIRVGDVFVENFTKDDGTSLKCFSDVNQIFPYQKLTYRTFTDSPIYNSSNIGSGLKPDASGNLTVDPTKIDATQLLNIGNVTSGGFKGTINFGGNLSQFSNAQKNQFWQANIAGSLGGLNFNIGDNLYCIQNVTGVPANLTDATTWSIKANVNAIATSSSPGQVKPDGVSINVDATGLISVPTSTAVVAGVSKPDGATIKATGGVYSAVNATGTTNGVVRADNTTIKIDGNGVMSSALSAATYSIVGSQAAMLALPKLTNLTICTRTDNNHVYYLNANQDPTVLANWVDGGSTANNVLSFNARTGAILPVAGDYKAYIASWALANIYSAGESVRYTDGNIYVANGAIQANTAWVVGTTGATWQLLIPTATVSSVGQVKISNSLPTKNGNATPGALGTVADAGHVHPRDIANVPQWALATAYSMGDLVRYSDGNIYAANSSVPANTAWVVGNSGATWSLVTTPVVSAWVLGSNYSQGSVVTYTDNTQYVANAWIPANTAWAIGTTGATWKPLTALASTAPLALGVAAIGTSNLAARQDHVHARDTANVSAWALAKAYKAGDLAMYIDSNIYMANTDIPANTAFSMGTSGATWMPADSAIALAYNSALAYQKGELTVYTDNNVYIANGFIPANTTWSIGTTGATWKAVAGSGTASSLNYVSGTFASQNTTVGGVVGLAQSTQAGNLSMSSNAITLQAGQTYLLMMNPYINAFTNWGSFSFKGSVSGVIGPYATAATANYNGTDEGVGYSFIFTSPSTQTLNIISNNSVSLTPGYGGWSILQVSGTNGNFPVYTGASASVAGNSGAVPPCPAGNQNSFLRGDGTWVVSNSLQSITSTINVATGTFAIGSLGSDTFSININASANGVINLNINNTMIAFGQYMAYYSGSWQAFQPINQVSNGAGQIQIGNAYNNTQAAIQGCMQLYKQNGSSMYQVGWSRIAGDGAIVITITKLN